MRCEYVAADVLQLRQPLQQKRESVGLGRAEAARGNGRERDGGGTQGKKRKEADDATQRATHFVSCSVLRDARERDFFSLRADHYGLS